MKRSRYTEEQIIGILKEQEAGVPVAELCRKHGMSDATFYNWKSKYGGLEVSEARRLGAASGSWLWSTTARANAWRWWRTPRSPAGGSPASRTGLSRAAVGPAALCRITAPS